MVLIVAHRRHADFLQPRKPGNTMLRRNVRLSSYPDDMKNKIYLLKHFEKYMMTKLYGDYEYTFVDKDKTRGMEFVQKYFRTKHVMLFQLSHEVLQVRLLVPPRVDVLMRGMQFNFNDHSKMILAQNGMVVAHIDKEYRLTHWTLSEIFARALEGSDDPLEQKAVTKLVEKLRYCREVLRQVPTAQQQQQQRKDAAAPTSTRIPELQLR